MHTRGRSRLAGWVRLALDVMWVFRRLLYGPRLASRFMIRDGLKASLLAGDYYAGVVELPT